MQNIGFILLPNFALMSYASAVEPLRAANLLAGRDIYNVRAYSTAGGIVEASSGATVATLPLPKAGRDLDTVLVCAGGNPAEWGQPVVTRHLGRLARDGVRIGGISGGPYLLAAAGLLENRRFTIHWEHAPALMEAFPSLVPEHARYVIDGNRITCGGGIAPLDMMHALIAEHMGRDFARRVSDWYLHTHIGEGSESQRGSLAETHGTHHPALLRVLDKMENTIENPMDRTAMAHFANVSERHLDRLFRTHLGSSFKAAYLKFRLDHARRLLRQSALSISEVALATGFCSSGHFSRTYRKATGHVPRDERRGLRKPWDGRG